MKIYFNLFLSFFCLMAMASCEDNGANTENNKFRKMKITIYESHSGDTNEFVKNSEYYFDGDVAGYPTRYFGKMFGVSNYQSILVQERSNVPLPFNKFGCLIKNIEYSEGSNYFSISHTEYDKDSYLKKFYFDSYSSSNKSMYCIYSCEGGRLVSLEAYKENILCQISRYFYDANGLCTLQIDSSIAPDFVNKTYRRYNDKKELIYEYWGEDTSSNSVMEYFYDDDGNNIKQLEYVVRNSDTTEVKVRNWVMHKGYRIEQDKIDRFIFDSNDNIIGYINPDFGKTRYKIEYLYY